MLHELLGEPDSVDPGDAQRLGPESPLHLLAACEAERVPSPGTASVQPDRAILLGNSVGKTWKSRSVVVQPVLKAALGSARWFTLSQKTFGLVDTVPPVFSWASRLVVRRSEMKDANSFRVLGSLMVQEEPDRAPGRPSPAHRKLSLD